MPHYSLVIWTPLEMPLPEHRILLDPGTNAVRLFVDDPGALKERLEAEGARVIQMHCLDNMDPIEPEESALDGLLGSGSAPGKPTARD